MEVKIPALVIFWAKIPLAYTVPVATYVPPLFVILTIQFTLLVGLYFCGTKKTVFPGLNSPVMLMLDTKMCTCRDMGL